jgi:hypothetical protein
LSGFCRDLGELLAQGELPAMTGPRCRPELAPSLSPFRFSGAPNIDEFAAFYLRSRFFTKGSACASCLDADRCAGLPVVEARRLGFSALKARVREAA